MDKYFRIGFFILCIFATSCVTINKCKEKFPENYITGYRDTVFIFRTETDTVFNTGYITDTVYASTGQAAGQAWVTHDTIKLKVWQKDTILVFRDSIRTEVKEIHIQDPPKFNGVLWQIIGVLFLAIVLIIFLRKLIR